MKEGYTIYGIWHHTSQAYSKSHHLGESSLGLKGALLHPNKIYIQGKTLSKKHYKTVN